MEFEITFNQKESETKDNFNKLDEINELIKDERSELSRFIVIKDLHHLESFCVKLEKSFGIAYSLILTFNRPTIFIDYDKLMDKIY